MGGLSEVEKKKQQLCGESAQQNKSVERNQGNGELAEKVCGPEGKVEAQSTIGVQSSE